MHAHHSHANAMLGLLPDKKMLSRRKATNMFVSRIFWRKLSKYLNTKTCRNPLIAQDYQNCRRKLLRYLVKWHQPTKNIVHISTLLTDFQIY